MAVPSIFRTLPDSVVTSVRRLSTSAVMGQMVKCPIQLFGIEGRYAMALYSAASKKKALAAVEKDLKEITGLLKTDKVLREFLSNPLLQKDLKKAAINSVLEKKKASPLTGNLLVTMADNGRIQKIEGVANAFSTIMATERGEVLCEVTTAKVMDDAITKELETILKSFVKKGETIKLTTKIDPNIIGGMVISVGDKYIDMSMVSKISKYSNLIQQAV